MERELPRHGVEFAGFASVAEESQGRMRSSVAKLAFSRTLMLIMRPSGRRSSGTSPMPWRIASRGDRGAQRGAAQTSGPLVIRSRPNSAAPNSLRPLPTRPATPSTSPRRRVNDTFRNSAGA